MILSQLETQTSASTQWPLAMYSTLCAISFPGWTALKHAVMTHRDRVVDPDRVEFLRDATGTLDFPSDELAKILELEVPWNELGERVSDCDDRLAKIGISHAGGWQRPRAPTMFRPWVVVWERYLGIDEPR